MSKDTLIGVGVNFVTTCRVTGYLSNYSRINGAKQEEIRDRTVNTKKECEQPLVKLTSAA